MPGWSSIDFHGGTSFDVITGLLKVIKVTGNGKTATKQQNLPRIPLHHAIKQTAIILFYTNHFLINLTNHSSSGWNPKKAFPSPPKSQERITSKDFKGRRCVFPWCNNTCALRRNLRLLACFPFFCDLQQHQVLPGIRFLLLLIVS